MDYLYAAAVKEKYAILMELAKWYDAQDAALSIGSPLNLKNDMLRKLRKNRKNNRGSWLILMNLSTSS